MNILAGVTSTASALNAERIRMEVVSQNIANANVSRSEDGKPYQRQVVHFESVMNGASSSGAAGQAPQSLQVAHVEKDLRPARMVYNPSDPAHDANGWVKMPDINIHEEMVDLIAASRAYEANLAVVKSSRNMAMQTLTIGKR